MVGYTFPRLRGKYPEGGMGGAAGAYLTFIPHLTPLSSLKHPKILTITAPFNNRLLTFPIWPHIQTRSYVGDWP